MKNRPANLVLLLLDGDCAPASSYCLPAFTVNQQKCALELAPDKKHLPPRASALKPSKLAFLIWRNNPHFGVL